MTSVTLTAAMRQNLLSLQSSATLLGQTQNRLATGNKVNSALDNPSSFFAAQGLNNRADDLSSLLDGMGQGIQALKAADNAITSITALVKQAKATAQAAMAAGATTASGAIIESGDFSAAIAANLTAAGGFTNADKFTLTSSITAGANAILISTGDTLEGLAAQITAVGGGGIFTATVVDGSIAGSKRLRIENVDGGAGLGDTTIANTAATPVATLYSGGGVAGGQLGFISQTGAANAALVTAGVAGNITSVLNDTTSVNAYKDTMDQIVNLIDDASYQGTNLLQATGTTLEVLFSEKNANNKESVDSVNLFTDMTLETSGSVTWASTANIQTSLDTITTALATLRSTASTFGNALAIVTARQDYTNNLINTLKDGASQLTLADKNEEGANILALQTSQQLGIQALSLASQANQSVLRLFQ